MKILHLILKKEWFEKIASGEKTSEYREIKTYWDKRLSKKYDIVIFHKGYTDNTMSFEIKSISKTKDKNDLNLEEVYEIKLGEIVKEN